MEWLLVFAGFFGAYVLGVCTGLWLFAALVVKKYAKSKEQFKEEFYGHVDDWKGKHKP